MRVAFAMLLILHGIAHLVGFLTPWGLVPSPATLPAPAPAPNALFGGRVVLDQNLARGVGVIWLVVGISIVVSAIGLWRREPWALGAVVTATLVSLALCIAWWPTTRIGVVVNIAIIAGLLTVGYFVAV